MQRTGNDSSYHRFQKAVGSARRQQGTFGSHLLAASVKDFSSSRSRKPTVNGARHPLWAAVERPTVKYRQAKWYRGSKFATAQIYVL